MNRSLKVIGIGEVLWDLLPTGKQLGGAPTNFSFHAHQLGLQSSIITVMSKNGANADQGG
jgi:fructokinase